MTGREMVILSRLTDAGSAGLSAFDFPVSERGGLRALEKRAMIRFVSEAGDPAYGRWVLTAAGASSFYNAVKE